MDAKKDLIRFYYRQSDYGLTDREETVLKTRYNKDGEVVKSIRDTAANTHIRRVIPRRGEYTEPLTGSRIRQIEARIFCKIERQMRVVRSK